MSSSGDKKKYRYARIAITRTPGEWKALEEKLGKPGVKKYIQTSAFKLSKQFEECPGCFTPGQGKPVQKNYVINETTHTLLLKLSAITSRPMSSLIEELFIAPLLLPGKA